MPRGIDAVVAAVMAQGGCALGPTAKAQPEKEGS
jgi:hypothetical protein